MSMEIPDLRAVSSRRLVACGRLDQPPTLLSKGHFVAKVTRHRKVMYVRLIVSEPKRKSQHFHLEVATPDYFSGRRVPEPNAKFSKIEDLVDSVTGQEIQLYIIDEFVVNITALPEFGGIRTLSKEIRSGGTSMRLTGGTLALEGSPISEVAWTMLDDSMVSVSLELRQKSVISETYLLDAHQLVAKLFSVFVLENEAENSLAPRPYRLRHPVFVTIKPSDGEFIASLIDANINTTGDTEHEAIENLKEFITGTFDRLRSLGSARLGPGPSRTLAVLEDLLLDV